MKKSERNVERGIWKFVFVTVMVSIAVTGAGFFLIQRMYLQSRILESASISRESLERRFPARPDVDRNTAHVFYTRDGLHLSPHEIRLSENLSQTDTAKYLLGYTLRKSPYSYLESAVPQGVRLLAVFALESTVIVDLSQEFIENQSGGTTAEILAAYAMVNALVRNIPGVEKVRILVEGKPPQGLSLDYSEPFAENNALYQW